MDANTEDPHAFATMRSDLNLPFAEKHAQQNQLCSEKSKEKAYT